MTAYADYPVAASPTDHVGPPAGQTIEEAFEEFHARNPHVYRALVALAREAQERGIARIGIGMLFEVLRWNHALQTSGDPDFKLNNNFRSYYARLIMLNEPGLAGIFETRALQAGQS